jgi:hypothetical protein
MYTYPYYFSESFNVTYYIIVFYAKILQSIFLAQGYFLI